MYEEHARGGMLGTSSDSMALGAIFVSVLLYVLLSCFHLALGASHV